MVKKPNQPGEPMKTKPSAFYAGQDDETREHMVIIEDNRECQCARPSEDHTENICFKYDTDDSKANLGN